MVRRQNHWFALHSAAIVLTVTMIGCQKSEPSALTDGDKKVAEESIPMERLTSFQLTREDGSEFTSEDLAGQVWVASYFFTRCGSNCRLLNMEIARLQREFGEQGVRFVSVSCDPSYDSPDVLARYADLFNANSEQWVFATGEMEYLKRVGKDMLDVSVVEKNHDAQLTIVDQKGKLCGTFEALDPAQLQLAKNVIQKLLSQAKE